jgi:hypothetical protein
MPQRFASILARLSLDYSKEYDSLFACERPDTRTLGTFFRTGRSIREGIGLFVIHPFLSVRTSNFPGVNHRMYECSGLLLAIVPIAEPSRYTNAPDLSRIPADASGLGM